MNKIIRSFIFVSVLVTSACGTATLASGFEDATTTPEIYIPLDKAIPENNSGFLQGNAFAMTKK